MKVKASAFKTENLRLTLGKEYEVINMMPIMNKLQRIEK